jgi:hypothetical protein
MVAPSNHHIQSPKVKLTPKHLLKEISYLLCKAFKEIYGNKFGVFHFAKKIPQKNLKVEIFFINNMIIVKKQRIYMNYEHEKWKDRYYVGNTQCTFILKIFSTTTIQ